MSAFIKVKWSNGPAMAMSKEAATAGCVAGATAAVAFASLTVPRGKTGALADSAKVIPGVAKATIRYTAVYAHYMHENLEFNFTPPGRAKWLQYTMEEQNVAISTVIGAGVKEDWK